MNSLITELKKHIANAAFLAVVYFIYALAVNMLFFGNSNGALSLILFSLLGGFTSYVSCALSFKLFVSNALFKSIAVLISIQLGILVTFLPLFGLKTYLVCALLSAIYGGLKRYRKHQSELKNRRKSSGTSAMAQALIDAGLLEGEMTESRFKTNYADDRATGTSVEPASDVATVCSDYVRLNHQLPHRLLVKIDENSPTSQLSNS